MGKIYLYLIIALFSFIIVCGLQSSIYDQVKEIKSSPGAYTLVIGKKAAIEEVKIASELAGFLGIKRSNFASKIKSSNNLVIVGLLENNEKIAENTGDVTARGVLIKAEGSNLIVAGSGINDLKKAVETVKNYEKNKAGLSKSELSSINLFAPIKEIFSSMIFIYVIAIILIIAGSTALIIHHKSTALEKPKQLVSPTYTKLKKYITENLKKGYSERQIKVRLINSGWKPDLLDSIFDDIANAPNNRTYVGNAKHF